MEFQYQTQPYEHQRQVFEETRDLAACGLFLEMGLGKSKVILDTAAWQYIHGGIHALLLIAPKGVYTNWVKTQIPLHLPDVVPHEVFVWDSSKAKNKSFQAAAKGLFTGEPRLRIVVMNIEALNSDLAYRYATALLKRLKVMMVVDESTTIKNPKAKWTKRAIQLARSAAYKRILTGTPITNSPLDIYSQFDFLDPDLLGFKSYYAFRNRYAIVQKEYVNTHSFDKIVGYQRLDELKERIKRGAVLIRKEECLDLPDKIYMDPRRVELSAEQKQLYEHLKVDSYAELRYEGELKGTVTADMVLVKLLRLHQIACGFVTVDPAIDPNPLEIDPDGGPRVKELLTVLEELDGKTIIWANYTYNIRTIERVLKQRYGAAAVASFYGATPQDERDDIVDRFQDPLGDLRFFVGQPRTGGFGLTLTAASNVIYFSSNYSLELRLQSEDRAHRMGQHKNVTYVDLVAPGTVDEVIVQALRNKQNLADQLVGEGWRKIFE